MSERIAQNDGSIGWRRDSLTATTPASDYLPRFLFAGRFASNADVSRHTHECEELVLVTDGHCQMQVADKWIDAPKGSLCILPAEAPQFQREMGFTRTSYVGFQVSPLVFDTSLRVVTLFDSDLAWRWIEDLVDLGTIDGYNLGLVGDALLLAVLERINVLEKSRRQETVLHPDLACALEFIEENFMRSIGVKELALHAHLSPSHLTALFRARFGHGPARYVQGLRMQRARALLCDPYLRIEDIARQCGYEEANYFVRIFRKCHGISPGRWRTRSF